MKFVYFEYMESQINPSELQLNNANTAESRAAFLDFLDDDVPRSTSYGVYISQLNRFARASSYITDFNTHNKLLTQKLLKQGIINFAKPFLNFIDDTMI